MMLTLVKESRSHFRVVLESLEVRPFFAGDLIHGAETQEGD
jgi:hypothetical protein